MVEDSLHEPARKEKDTEEAPRCTPLPVGVAECQRGKAWGEMAWQDKELESQAGEEEHEDSDHPCSVTAPTAQDLCLSP